MRTDIIRRDLLVFFDDFVFSSTPLFDQPFQIKYEGAESHVSIIK